MQKSRSLFSAYASSVVVAATFLGCLTSLELRAEEGGVGHEAPGSAAAIIDLAPTKPGFIVEPVFLLAYIMIILEHGHKGNRGQDSNECYRQTTTTLSY